MGRMHSKGYETRAAVRCAPLPAIFLGGGVWVRRGATAAASRVCIADGGREKHNGGQAGSRAVVPLPRLLSPTFEWRGGEPRARPTPRPFGSRRGHAQQLHVASHARAGREQAWHGRSRGRARLGSRQECRVLWGAAGMDRVCGVRPPCAAGSPQSRLACKPFGLLLVCVRARQEAESRSCAAAVHNNSKGISRSAKPYRRSAPSWLKANKNGVVDQITKMAKKGMTPSQIGVMLRDSHGIAQVKAVTGSKILRILKSQGKCLFFACIALSHYSPRSPRAAWFSHNAP